MTSALAANDVFIVDDDEMMRDALSVVFTLAGYRVTGFATGQSFLTATRERTPVCVLLGLRLPDKSGMALLKELNEDHREKNPGDARLDARISSYELAAKMQLSAPEVLDISKEPDRIHKLYGTDNPTTAGFARNCLTARRMLERGVRFVQVWSGMGGPSKNWDNHSNIEKELPFIATQVDRPTAGLLRDMKARGMFEDTLIVWTTEFGRMPFTQGETGRDHNGGTFVTWLAGAGIKGGVAHGASDEFSYQAGEGRTYCYDLHATILHLLGIDHEKLTFRHNGIDRRLTDVHGHVIDDILA